jgi:hypothetical protein
MILGLSLATFTLVHVVISLFAIAAGLNVMFGMLASKRMPAWTAFFLLTTILTSVSGFFFPIKGFTPALAVGALSLLLLAVAVVALYIKHLAGRWRWIYVGTALASLYFNVLVLIVQSFEKLAILNPRAPMTAPLFDEPTNMRFVIVQVAALAFFALFGILALIKFRPGTRLPY